LLPADLLVQFEPWKSQVAGVPYSHWDPLVWDGIAQYYPWRLFAAETLRSGLLPLWNPYQFCGTPFIANGQSAVFYPPNLIFWLLPTAAAFGWSAWFHLVLTGWFAYLFLRRIGTGRVGSVAGAVVWQGNGFFIAWIHLPTVLCTAAWLPLILLLIEKAVAPSDSSTLDSPGPRSLGEGGSTVRYSVAAGLALSLSYLGGHPQVFLFVALLTAAYIIARGLSRAAAQTLRQRAARLFATGAVAGTVGLGLASVQLLPTLDLLRITHRAFVPGPESYRAFLSHAMPPLQLGGLLMPHAFGHPALGSYAGRDNYAEFACYVGIIALPLALWAIVASRTWHARFLGATTLIVFLIVLGTPINEPLYRWLPGFARAGGPGRMLILAVYALAMLAGIGLDELARRPKPANAAVGLVWLLAALSLGSIAWLLLVTPVLAQVQPGILSLSTTERMRATLLWFAAFGAAMLTARRPKVTLAQVAVVVMLALDLVLASQGHLHICPGDWAYPPIKISAPGLPAGREAGQGRILGNAADWPINRFPNAVLPPNSATVYHLRDAFGYDSLYLARYRDFAAAIQHGDPSPPLNGNMLLARLGPQATLASVYGLDMMSLAGVETVLSPIHVRGLRMETAGAYYTYSNPYARPRAWVASSAVFVPTHAEAVASLATLGPMPETIIITGPDDLGPVGATSLSRPVELRDISPNAVEIRIEGRGGGYLFLADAFAPGWTAHADKRQLPIRPANVAFRTVALPPDAGSVLFRYEPAAFRIGLFIALLTCAAVAVTAATVVTRGR
jgi:hypothetical protein